MCKIREGGWVIGIGVSTDGGEKTKEVCVLFMWSYSIIAIVVLIHNVM